MAACSPTLPPLTTDVGLLQQLVHDLWADRLRLQQRLQQAESDGTSLAHFKNKCRKLQKKLSEVNLDLKTTAGNAREATERMENAMLDAEAARTLVDSLRSQMARQLQLNKAAMETTHLHHKACKSYKAEARHARDKDAAAAGARVAWQSALAQCQAEVAQALAKPECVVCMDNEATMVLTPCGHLCVCQGCSFGIRVCPICRGPVGSKVLLRCV